MESDIYETGVLIREEDYYYLDERQLYQRIGKYLSSLEALEQE